MNSAAPSTDDPTLLRRFVATNSTEAFHELVDRHLPLVYRTALRTLQGDAHSAEDVAQTVFCALARKARGLVHHPSLAGWLRTSAHLAAAQTVRTSVRRQRREQAASVEGRDNPPPAWSPDEMAALQGALDELSPSDRDLLQWRFAEGLDHAAIANRLGVSPDAARMRQHRLLRRLRTRIGPTPTTTEPAVETDGSRWFGALLTSWRATLPRPELVATIAARATPAGAFAGLLAGGGLLTWGVILVGVGLTSYWALRPPASVSPIVPSTTSSPAISPTATRERSPAAAPAADSPVVRPALPARSETVGPPVAPEDRLRALVAATDEIKRRIARLDYAGALRLFRNHFDLAVDWDLGAASLRNVSLLQAAQPLLDAYAPARDYARQQRDLAEARLLAGESPPSLDLAWVNLNQALGDAAHALEVYDALSPTSPRKTTFRPLVATELLAAQRYPELFSPEIAEVDRFLSGMAQVVDQLPTGTMSDFIAQDWLMRIEILAGVGQIAAAHDLSTSLLLYRDSPSTRAEITERWERAGQAPPAELTAPTLPPSD